MTDPRAMKLRDFLAQETAQPDLEIDDFSELVAGWSRSTYLATIESAAQPRPRRIVIQVEKADSVIVDSSVERDVQVLRVLAESGLPVARPLWYSADPAILGGPLMVTEFLQGRTFDTSNADHRAALREHWQRQSALPAAIVDTMVQMHASPVQALSFLPSAGSGDATAGYEIERCRMLAREARADGDPVVALAFHWLERHRPVSGSLGLVHGDFNMRNLLIDGERVSGIVDWEVARLSNPLFDLAYMSIPYLNGKFFAPGADLVGGLLPLEWMLAEYGRRSGRSTSAADFLFWRVLATLNLLLVIAKGVSDFEAGVLTSIRNAWARFSEPVLQEDILNLLRSTPAAAN